MKTKELIEFLEVGRYPYCGYCNDSHKKLNEVISLLQQGEKYKKMWEEIKKDSYGCEAWWSKHGLMRYEQKYFPKEVKSK